MGQALESLADEELARRACAGSAVCYEEIVRRYQVPLLRFLTTRFPSRRDAEDILQDTFVKAWQALHRYDSRYAFRTWMYTIAYRLAVSRGRRESVVVVALPEQTAAAGPQPELRIEEDESRGTLWRKAREVLSEEQYMALWLFYVDEVPAGDVAQILNRSWVSVKTLMHRARRKLAPYLAELAPDGALRPAAATVKAGDT
jgi:RNA polymerase sigma-70 factor (ECF subfamily)